MIGNILQQDTTKRLVLYQLDTICLSLGISDSPVVTNNIIDVVIGNQDSYYLSGELYLGAFAGFTIDICSEEIVLNLLHDRVIIRTISALAAQWGQGTGNPSPEALKALESLINFMKGTQNN